MPGFAELAEKVRWGLGKTVYGQLTVASKVRYPDNNRQQAYPE